MKRANLLDEVYSKEKRIKAAASWQSFLAAHHARTSEELNASAYRYRVYLRQDDFFGCVQFNDTVQWYFLHGDYDLKDLIPAGQPEQNLWFDGRMNGHEHTYSKHFIRVQRHVNFLIKTPMIQHGSEFGYSDHSEDAIWVFVPNLFSQHQGGPWLIQGKQRIEKMYEDVFTGRIYDKRLIADEAASGWLREKQTANPQYVKIMKEIDRFNAFYGNQSGAGQGFTVGYTNPHRIA
jgi:hypothetical protein